MKLLQYKYKYRYCICIVQIGTIWSAQVLIYNFNDKIDNRQYSYTIDNNTMNVGFINHSRNTSFSVEKNGNRFPQYIIRFRL